jgi:hypothetical protein
MKINELHELRQIITVFNTSLIPSRPVVMSDSDNIATKVNLYIYERSTLVTHDNISLITYYNDMDL